MRPLFLASLILLPALLGSPQVHGVATDRPLPKSETQAISLEEVVLTPAPRLQGTSQEEVILPVEKIPLSPGAPTFTQSLGAALQLRISETGQTGGKTQLVGLGRSAEETNVHTLGVPLNLPQGGGFDFASLPAFLWAGAEYQASTRTSSNDPRALTESLGLIPWTAEKLDGQVRASDRQASLLLKSDYLQLSTGQRNGHYGLLAGGSAGRSRGGGLGASVALGQTRLHLLGHSGVTEVPGSLTFPTPGALQTTHRYLAVAESLFALNRRHELRALIYGDVGALRYQDPGQGNARSAFESSDRSLQGGADLNWRALPSAQLQTQIGSYLRATQYQSDLFQPPFQAQAQLRFSALFSPSAPLSTFGSPHQNPLGSRTPGLLLEFGSDLTGVTRLGWYPSVQLGAVWRPKLSGVSGLESLSLFLRPSYQSRFPSLTDQTYSMPGFFIGNPNLAPERIGSLRLGQTLEFKNWSTQNEFILSRRANTQIYAPDAVLIAGESWPRATMINSGASQMAAFRHQFKASLTDFLAIQHSLQLTTSLIHSTGQPFPYLAPLRNIIALSFHSPGFSLGAVGGVAEDLQSSESPTRSLGWELTPQLRSVSAATENLAGAEVGGYSLLALEGSLHFKDFTLGLRIDNLARRQIEVIRGYPLPKQEWTLHASLRL
jgi:hypothetical protein